VQEDLFVWPSRKVAESWQRKNLQTESCIDREHNARRTAPGIAHATTGITASVLTLLFAPHTLSRATSSVLTYKVRGAKRWNNGNRAPITMSGFTKEQYIGQMLAQWLPSGLPLARRMHRNTRTTLPQYYEMKYYRTLRQSAVPKTSCLIISSRRSAKSTTIWLGAFRSISKSWKSKTLSDATAETFSR
jgi:hypothetical protein